MALRTLGSTARDALRRPSATLASSASSSSSSSSRIPSSSRHLHALPPTPKNVAEGAMPLLSKSTVDMLWQGWQKGLLERLNEEVRGTELEKSSLVDTIIATAQKPERIMAFNYASLALNNAFFLSQITSPAGISQDPTNKDYLSTPPPKLTGPLARAIEDTWGSLTTFKSAMSSAALGMSSSGYVWLVVDGLGHLGIVPTFGAGTVLVQNRRQKGPAGLQGLAAGSLEEQERQASKEGEEGYASPGAPDEAKEQPSRSLYDPSAQQPSSTASALKPDIYAGLGSAMASNPEDDVGQTLTPLLCMSGYEHAWLPDWGVWGKETYLARFWEVVDWEKVEGIWQQHRDAGAAERSWRVR
ncbi:manganese and iron superoxide dismutase [Jaminaea rosea]|uniref:Manganese and iron superoxide dismutase n=1 Tax=Jaminaea rosea TaxID=1569628 RepID=A0A316UZ23_9BASI|nr:manganese and iron superoxide dismutase [Jaminaea rosea]PWN30567.1 manganese and iron superoxide dismutase [Jaminaea rosea]